MFVADVVRLAQSCRKRLIVVRQFREHIQGLDVLGVVIYHSLGARDVADRFER